VEIGILGKITGQFLAHKIPPFAAWISSVV